MNDTKNPTWHALSRLAVMVVAVAGLAACGGEDDCVGEGCRPPPSGVTCSAANCGGCCQGNVCLGGASETACGINGTTCTSCPSGYACNSGVCTGCTDHLDCATTSDVCVGGACTTGFGRTYDLKVTSVEVPTLDGNGEAWDLLGGAPDPFVCLYLDGAEAPVSCSQVVDDVFSAEWNHTFTVTAESTTRVLLLVWDEDATAPDLVAGLRWDSGTNFLNTARQGGFSGTPEGSQVAWEVAISPR